jgi:hypothetical protein
MLHLTPSVTNEFVSGPSEIVKCGSSLQMLPCEYLIVVQRRARIGHFSVQADMVVFSHIDCGRLIQT